MSRMISELDAVVIAVHSLAEAADDYASLLGQPAREEEFRGITSVRFQLANTAVRLVETDERQGLKQLIFACPDTASAQQRLPKVGLEFVEAQSDDRFLSLQPETTRGLNLALTEQDTAGLDYSASESAIEGLDHAVIASGDGDLTSALLSARLQLDMRLDLTNPDWDARLLFFRCGDLIVEVYQPIAKPLPPEQDRFFGLSWRSANIDATNAELRARGFDVSDVRVGRRAGTRVCTVRDRTHGVPTLILGRD